MRKFLLLFFILLTPHTSYSKTIHLERVYQRFWCDRYGGHTEVRLPDHTRVDCLTKSYAIEVDFAKKWAESIGQALYYGIKTSKKPGILIIIENPHERRFLKRLTLTIKESHLPIKVWVVSPDDLR